MATQNQTSSVQIGSVFYLKGKVTATGADGAERDLLPGDPVYADDLIQTADKGNIVIDFLDGNRFALGGSSQALLDSEVFDPKGAIDLSGVVASVEALQQAIAAGEDPTDRQQAPAAGDDQTLEDSIDSSLFRVERTGRQGAVDSGYGTLGLAGAGGAQGQELLAELTAEDLVNPTPSAGDVSAEGDEDSAIPVTLVGFDTDGIITGFTLTSLPTNGILFLDSAMTQIAPSGVALDAIDNSLTLYFQPNSNFFGNEEFSYFVTDDSGRDSDPALAAIDINPVNDDPEVSPIDLGSINEDGNFIITVADLLHGATDVDGDTLNVNQLALSSGNGSLVDNGNGTWTFTPAPDWNGDVTFQFLVTDGAVDVPNVANLTVTPVADAPSLSMHVGEPVHSLETVFADDFNDGDLSGWQLVKFAASSYSDTPGSPGWHEGQTSDAEWNAQWVEQDGMLWWNRGGLGEWGSADEYGMIGRDAGQYASATSYTIAADINAQHDDPDQTFQNNDVGIVFGYVDDSNYYVARWESAGSLYSTEPYPGDYRQLSLVKMVGGTPTDLTVLDGFYREGEFNLRVAVHEAQITVSVDNVEHLTYTFPDGELPPQLNSYGLYSFDNDNGVSFDNVSLQVSEYSYSLVIAASLSDRDGSEVLSDVTLTQIPAGVSVFQGGAEIQQVNGEYAVQVSSGVPETVTLIAGSVLTPEQLNAISGSVVATELSGESATTSVTALIELLGTAADETLTGSDANELVDGGVGSDTLIGGGGDDFLVYDSLDLGVDGGEGSDTLQINGSVSNLGGTITNIESLSMADHAGDDLVALSLADVLQITDSDHVLQIEGDSGDGLTLNVNDGWVQSTTAPGEADYRDGYVLFEVADTKLYVDEQVDVGII